MLVMLSAVDLVDAIVLLPEPEQHTTSQGHGSVTLCEVQGVLAIFSETSSFFWTAAVAVFLFHDSRDSEQRPQCLWLHSGTLWRFLHVCGGGLLSPPPTSIG